MRHVRVRRRFKIILTMLLAFSAILLFETKVESFAPQLKILAESKIENVFEKRVRLSIETIEGGILHPLTVSGCSIMNDKGAPLFPYLEIKSIRSNYRIWDVLLKQENPLSILNPFSRGSYIDVIFGISNKEILGFVRIEGDIENAKIKGYLNIYDEERIDVIGSVKKRSFKLDLRSPFGVFKASGTLSEANELVADIKVAHLQVKGLDITCDAVIKNRFVGEEGTLKKGYLEGEFTTKRLVINYMPFYDLKASYRISDGILHVSRLNVGSDIRIYGKAYLGKPYNIDVAMIADNVNLSQLLSRFNINENAAVTGTLNGKFAFKGPIGNPKLEAKMEIRNGEIGNSVDFDTLSARLKGEGPILRIEESRITRESGWFVLAGEINMAKAGKGNIFEDVKLVSDDRAIIWDGWDAKSSKGVEELRMEKKMSEDVNLGYKRYLPDKKVDESIRDSDEFEIQYKLHPHDSLKVQMGQDEDFFGYQYRDKF